MATVSVRRTEKTAADLMRYGVTVLGYENEDREMDGTVNLMDDWHVQVMPRGFALVHVSVNNTFTFLPTRHSFARLVDDIRAHVLTGHR